MNRWETTTTHNEPIVYRTTRARDRAGARVGTFWALFAFDVFVGGVAAMQLHYGYTMAILEYSLWFGFFCASAVGLPVLLWRMYQHDNLQLDYHERIEQPAPEQPAPLVQPVVQNNEQSVIRFGKFKFTANEWSKLAASLAANGGKVTRDAVGQAGVFQNITANWRDIVTEFERLGWARNGQLTTEGEEWLSAYGYPPSPKS